MGNVLSIGGSMHKIAEVDRQSAISLSTKSPKIMNELSDFPFFQDVNMARFLEKIYIAENTMFVSESGVGYMAKLNLNPKILTTNLEAIKQVLFDIASLPQTGQSLLKEN